MFERRPSILRGSRFEFLISAFIQSCCAKELHCPLDVTNTDGLPLSTGLHHHVVGKVFLPLSIVSPFLSEAAEEENSDPSNFGPPRLQITNLLFCHTPSKGKIPPIIYFTELQFSSLFLPLSFIIDKKDRCCLTPQ